MPKDIENLIRLQELDLQIHELEQSKIDLPVAVEEREGTIRQAEEDLQETSTKLADAKSQVKEIGERIQSANDALSKSQERLNAISTNREYDAVHAEIENSKSIVATGQDKLDNANQQAETLSEKEKTAQENLEKIKSEHEPEIKDLKEKIASIDSRIAEVVEKRNQIVPLLPKHILNTYEFILKRRKNGRVLSLVDDSRTCTVCFKRLEPQIINELRKAVKTPSCQSCGSLLVWSELQPDTEVPEEASPPEENQG